MAALIAQSEVLLSIAGAITWSLFRPLTPETEPTA